MSTCSDFKQRDYFVYEFKHSYVELGKSQFWEGYCILFSKVDYEHLTDMPNKVREEYLMEMSILGDAMMEVLSPRRINYNILGNSHPVVHAHVFPRYEWEKEPLKQTVVWRYEDETFSNPEYAFDLVKHASLKEKLAKAIHERYEKYQQEK